MVCLLSLEAPSTYIQCRPRLVVALLLSRGSIQGLFLAVGALRSRESTIVGCGQLAQFTTQGVYTKTEMPRLTWAKPLQS